MSEEIKYRFIGIIHTPFKKPRGTPIQPDAAEEIEGTVEIFPQYIEGLKDIEGFSHIILLYHFHLSGEYKLIVKPFMDNNFHGVFATRASSRPNPIGISIVSLLRVRGNLLHIKSVDIVDGTPLLDIKPYVPQFDIYNVKKIGWLKSNIYKLPESVDDERFIK